MVLRSGRQPCRPLRRARPLQAKKESGFGGERQRTDPPRERLQDLRAPASRTRLRPRQGGRRQRRGAATVRPRGRNRQRELRGPQGRDLRGDGSLGVRQINRPPYRQQALGGHLRPRLGRRNQRPDPRRLRPPSLPPGEDGHGVPALRPVSPPQRHRQRGLRPEGAGDHQGGTGRRLYEGPLAGGPRTLLAQPPAATFGRHAAAGGAGPGAGLRPRHPPDGRGLLSTRPPSSAVRCRTS